MPNINNDIINDINKSMFSFIWDNKPDKIKRKTLLREYNAGGLKMIDLKRFIYALKASWVSRLVDIENKGKWKHIYLNQLKNVGVL